jgi:hypothetical protein
MDDFRLCRNDYGVLIILMFQRTPAGFVITIVATWNLAMLLLELCI